MATCPKCNAELSEGAKFCMNCGSPVVTAPAEAQPVAAPVEAQPVAQPAAQPVAAPVETPVEAKPEVKTEEKPKAKKKSPLKPILFGVLALVVIAAIAVAIILFTGGGAKGKLNYALYLKDNEIFFSDLKKDSKPWQVTSRFLDTDEVSNSTLSQIGYYMGMLTYMSPDGKYLFFPDKITNDINGFNLYFKKVSDPEADAQKIDSEVTSYFVNEATTVITYMKGEEGNLYQYNIKEDAKNKIASEVRNFKVSDDGSKICYVNAEGSLYISNAAGEKEKLASEISYMEYLSEDFKTVYYVKEDALYKQVVGGDKEKLATEVYQVLKIYDSGEVYFLTSRANEGSLMQYVDDDMKESDAAMKEPVEPAYPAYPTYPEYPDAPSYPSWWDFETDEAYQAAVNQYYVDYATYEAECDRLYDEYQAACDAWQDECDRLYDEYVAAREAYWEKEDRDELRAELEEETLDQSSYLLYYFNGTEKTLLTESYVGGYYASDSLVGQDAPVISYEAFKQSAIDKIKLSQIEYAYEVEELVEEALFSTQERYIAAKAAATLIEVEKEGRYFDLNAAGTVLYYIDNIPDEKNYGDLYCITIENGVVGKAEVYDTDVCAQYGEFLGDGKYAYYKDCKDSKGELYINKEKIDFDVYVYSIQINSDNGQFAYLTDWNEEKQYGTLKVYQEGKATKVSDDVKSFSFTPDGRITYLYDYSMNYYKGELHEWKTGETRKIDDGVIAVLAVFSGKSRGTGIFGEW